MTPKEKAKELIKKYRDISISFVDSIEGTCDMYINNEDAKECALIAVDEILDATIYYFDDSDYFVEYWRQVKFEINEL